jgi:hypothetical protein
MLLWVPDSHFPISITSTSSKQDDEALEEVLAQTASTLSAPTLTKRSRADINKELKERRTDGPRWNSQLKSQRPKTGSSPQSSAQ